MKASHGKGPMNGVGGTIKNLVFQEVNEEPKIPETLQIRKLKRS